jgi:uncharacterized protein (DUF1684 family)
MEMRWLAASMLGVTLLAASDYTGVILKWREEREAKLKAPDGWLSLVGLTWLKPGDNPMHGGVMRLENERVTFHHSSRTTDLKPDSPTDFVDLGGLKLYIIRRGQRYGVRVRDNDSETRRNFTKLDWFPVDPSWRMTAKYTPHAQQRTVKFNAVVGDPQEMINPGMIEFTRGGKTFRMMPVVEEGELFLTFRDTTAGKTTYPAARFLYAGPVPSRPGTVELDFNKAYNPPCVFTPYATCPLPPPDNRLSIPIEAGEKKYKAQWNSK